MRSAAQETQRDKQTGRDYVCSVPESARLRAYFKKRKLRQRQKGQWKDIKEDDGGIARNRILTNKNCCFDIKKNRKKDCNNEKTYEGTLRKEKSTALRSEE
ncbi:uncharacterized protein LOC122575262 [Bombus pyrosoma]|uniref:uncharacterized protein LOC122575262 n=1 Tax=Bombus pyrosoma TaxID=396416 RepID=UPI001CB8C25B|nr:uncharacterized protein LOC122575262 [Bombus pyrosoma]